MNLYAYHTTGLVIKALYNLFKARCYLHGVENIPTEANIFVINHFTRIETLLLPYYIYNLIRLPVWSLGHYSLFKGALGNFLNMVGTISTKNPHRDRLIVKTLLTGEAAWIIFPEGRMVKNKKILEKGRYMISTPDGQKRAPHTGAAAFGLRTEFFRQHFLKLREKGSDQVGKLMDHFGITDIEPVLKHRTRIVPVNVTYYPIRARENILSDLAEIFFYNMADRAIEELMTEGNMLFSGVDVDIRFGKPIRLESYLPESLIRDDIARGQKINFDDLIPSRKIMHGITNDIMHQYMTSIYNMTTINHDHLFASMLRQIPFRRIDESDLIRRVYCCAMYGLDKQNAYFHRTLEDDQISLLTDDLYHKYQDFISLALDKKTVIRKKNILIKNPKVFTSPFNFHRFRIENPVAVIANEVEPLKHLQRAVRLYAWVPGFLLRRILARRLYRKAIQEYQNDYQNFFSATETGKMSTGMPFLLRGSFRKIGVLLIHGYLAAPAEIKELAVYLNRQGYWVYAPRLKGHGTSPYDLAARTYEDWRTSVDEGYAVIKSLCSQVVVGGFSTGAGLALDLAARIKDVKGVFTICSPMRIRFLSSRFAPAVDVWNRLLKKIRLEENPGEFVDVEPENSYFKYKKNPVSGVREVERLMNSLEPRLAGLKTPALMVQSLNDPVVDYTGSMQLFELLGSEEKSYVMFDMDRHVIIAGPGSHRVHRAIAGFIEDVRKKFGG
jgi:esterase/lipase/1-acyl-sn-glycerol-3-phosphate acyltransferase